MGDASEGVEMVRPAALPRDLKVRAASGVVLAVVALTGNWAGHLPFAALVGLISLVMSWEWSRIVRGGALDVLLLVHGAAVAIAVIGAALGMAHWSVGVVLAGSVLLAVLAPTPVATMSALGVLYVGLPAVALVWLRGPIPTVRRPSCSSSRSCGRRIPSPTFAGG